MSDGPSSFKSYISLAEEEYAKNKKLTEAYEKVYERPESEVNKRLLPGEVAIGHAKKVIRYSANDDPTKGISGTLICSNFRIIFINEERPTCDVVELPNQLLGEQDILLNSVDSIFVEYSNKRKRLVPGSKVKDGIKRMEIYCKGFRVAAFNFKLTVKFEEKGIIKAILHHSYPTTVSLLFAFDFQHNYNVNEVCDIPLYRSVQDWEKILKKHSLSEGWRVSMVNHDYTVSETMCEYIIVPKTITDNLLSTAANQFNNNRLPVWCWKAQNGCYLLRSSELRSETDHADIEREIFDEVQQADPQFRSVKVVDIGKTCPNCSQIQQSFMKLKNLCTAGSADEFWSMDSSWLSSLHATKWLHHISAFLTTACDAVKLMQNDDYNLVIKESSGIDITPVITSLIQLLSDPSCRTLKGFQSLIQREWVVGGFPFLDRLGHLHQPSKSKPNSVISSEADTSSMSPVFLLFLDCVWQLTHQFPTAFQFSSTFLTLLHDQTRMTIFDSFVFNNERQRRRLINISEQKSSNPSWEPLPAWSWSLQFDDNSRKLFYNPLYRLYTVGLPQKYFIPLPPQIDQPDGSAPPTSLTLSLDSLNVVDENSLSAPSPVEDTPSPSDPYFTSINDVSADDVTPDSVQFHYNSKTGVVLAANADTPEGDKGKKKNRFSFRLKRNGRSVPNAPEDVSAPFTGSISSFIYNSTTPEVSKHQLQGIPRDSILRPKCALPNLVFWQACHSRWLVWSQLFGAAPCSLYHHESVSYDEIHSLYSKMVKLERDIGVDGKRSVPIPGRSEMYFRHASSTCDYNGDVSLPLNTPDFLTNFFPFSPVRETGRKFILGSPMYNSKGNSFFNFGSKSRSRHSRSHSDVSLTMRSADDATSSRTDASSNSCNNLLDEAAKESPPPQKSEIGKQKKKALMPPKKPLVPPTERISYISSV